MIQNPPDLFILKAKILFVFLPVKHALCTYSDHFFCLLRWSPSQSLLPLGDTASVRGDRNQFGRQEPCVLALTLIHLLHSLLTLYTNRGFVRLSDSCVGSPEGGVLTGVSCLCTDYLSKTTYE